MKYIQPFNVVASGISCEYQKCIYKFSMDEQKTAAVQPQSRIAILYTSFSKKQNSQFQKTRHICLTADRSAMFVGKYDFCSLQLNGLTTY